jgi:putative SOS response-associated peptidase YedK
VRRFRAALQHPAGHRHPGGGATVANWQDWLAAPAAEALPLVAPAPAPGMRAWPVSRRVSKAGDDDAALIEPLEP